MGVDFSGGASAGNKIWLARLEQVGPGDWVLQDLRRGREFPGSGPERSRALAALVDHLIRNPPRACGLDFPFSLSAPCLAQLDLMPTLTWHATSRLLAERFTTADEFYRYFHENRPSGRHRRTDRQAKAPFDPTNLRVFRQTYHGIVDLLLPLVESAGFDVLPMQPRSVESAHLLEVCPASTLKALGRYKPTYKGDDKAAKYRRGELLEWLHDQGVSLAFTYRDMMLNDKEADALDALLIAWTVATHWDRVSTVPTASQFAAWMEGIGLAEQREGWIFVPRSAAPA